MYVHAHEGRREEIVNNAVRVRGASKKMMHCANFICNTSIPFNPNNGSAR